ncbi:MAG: beta-ketoacyl-ACP synthase II [Planctomycetes bacterium]|nr:beta-ketoacyl-ACP synthase II [Planctomycetota bacterium]
MTHKVAVTGLGALTPLGLDVQSSWDAILAGKSGIGEITCMDASAFAVQIAGEVKGFDPKSVIAPKEVNKIDRYAHLAIAASEEAVKDSGLTADMYGAKRIGVVIGTGVGGLNTVEENFTKYMEKGPRRISPFVVPKMMCNAASGLVSIRHGFKGPNFAVVTACASANHSIGEASRLIKYGFADAVVTGGAEAAITVLGLGGFCSAKALSTFKGSPTEACRPFDESRDGFVLAEGAGVVVLENLEKAKARGAKIYAVLDGYGASGDAYHITAPIEDGSGGAEAMREALDEAEWNYEDVDYINAHGTSTPRGDVVETKVIKAVFGEHAKNLSVSSTKSSTGHTLGAAGGIEAVLSIKALQNGVMPGTLNHHTPDAECDLDYVPLVPREKNLKKVLSNSLGFGGHNSVLAFSSL